MTAAGAGGASTRSDSRRALAIFRRFAQGERRRFISSQFLMDVEELTVIAVPKLIGSAVILLKNELATIFLRLRATRGVKIPLLAVAVVLASAVSSLAESLSDVSLA